MGLSVYKAMSEVPDTADYLILGDKSAFTSNEEVETFESWLCTVLPSICENTICLFAGCENTANVNETLLPTLMLNYPAGTR
jgi:hypothetical protein